MSPAISGFGLWVEQLIAESTGKEGKGILPVADEPLAPPEAYGRDRVFVAVTLAGEEDPAVAARLDALERAGGHPVVRLVLEDPYDLGQEFFRWEFATAVAGAILRINPFDEPDVAASRANTAAVLEGGGAPSPPAGATELRAFLARIRPPDYLALMAYLPPTADCDRRLQAIRVRLRDRLKVATTLGYGPRLLHSTGQLHKGGPPGGHFLQITEAAREVGDRQGERAALNNLGVAYTRLSQYDTALTFYEQALSIAREVGDRRGEGMALGNLGYRYAGWSQYDQALTAYEQALTCK